MYGPVAYAQFVRGRQDAILRAFIDEPGHCFIGIPSLDAFRSRYYGQGQVRPLPDGTPVTEAFIWWRGLGTEELWVRPHDKAASPSDAYRGYWQRFVAALDGGSVSYMVDGKAQVVDHLLPETFAARQGYAYVRVMMVEQRGNATVGSTIEKSMAARLNPGKAMLADWFTAAKVSNFRGSFAASVSAATVMAALRAHIAARGFSVPAGQADALDQCMQAILTWSRG